MKGKHLSLQNFSFKLFKKIFFSFILLISFLLPFILNNIVFASNVGDEASNSYTVLPYDDNYATAEYWDEHYGTKRTYLQREDFYPGCTISTGSYFIKEDISVTGNGSNNKSEEITPAIRISGDVNIYLEKTYKDSPGPTLTFIGGNSNSRSGAAAGIELTEGNSLHFYGKGTVNANGGKWDGNDPGAKYPMPGIEGLDGWHGNIFLETISGGDSGAGSDGLGGCGAGIGTNGGQGGSGAEGVKGPQDYAGWYTSTGNNGNNGGAGGNTNNAGNLFSFGNVKINAIAGFPTNAAFKDAGSYGKGDKAGIWSKVAASYGGGGAGGGIGGAGWIGAIIGSGGAGGGGGASGGTGGTELSIAGHHEGKELYPHGGGGGNGASGLFHEKTGGKANPQLSHMDIPASDGGKISAVTSLNNNNSKGGNGAISKESGEDARDGGDGGDGGLGGLSGSGGTYYSSLIDYEKTNASEQRAEGTSSNFFRKFLDSMCGLAFYDSLVDWCGAYITDEVNEVRPKTAVCDTTSKKVLEDDYDKCTSPAYSDNVEAGKWATAVRNGKNVPGEDVVLCKEDNLEECGTVTDKFFLVRKGKVDIETVSKSKLYDGLPIYIDKSMVESITFEGEDVTSELSLKNFDVKFYKILDDKEIELSYFPSEAGTYRYQVYVYSKDYIGRSELATYKIAQKDASIQAISSYVEKGQQPPEARASVYGTIIGEEFILGRDYNLEISKTEQENLFLIKPKLIEDSSIIKNYYIKCVDGYLIFFDPTSEASLTVMFDGGSSEHSIVYGDNIPNFTVQADGFSGEQPVEGTDYEFVYDENIKDVGDYNIGIKLKPTATILAQRVSINPGKLTVQRKDVSLTVNNTSKVYGQEDPYFDVDVESTAYGEKFIQGADRDYTISRNEGKDVGTYTLTANVNENGPISRNYHVTESHEGTLTIEKKSAEIWADDVLNGYGLPEKALTLNQGRGLISGDVLKEGDDQDYSLSREHGPGDTESAGIYKITVTVHENGSVAKNYSLTVSKEATYTIREKTAKVTADNISTTYGEDKDLTVTPVGLIEEDIEKFKADQDYKIWRDPGKDVGEYTINIEIIDEGEVSKNYYFSEVNTGIYTITKKSASVSADDKTQIYGDSPKKLTITQSDFVYGEKLQEGDHKDYTISRDDPENIKAGKYAILLNINPDGPVAKNYNLESYNAEYTIEKADVTLLPYNNFKLYGDIDPEFRARVFGAKFEEEFTYNVDYSMYREEGEDADLMYSIYCIPNETEITANYNITTETGMFAIVKFNAFSYTDVASIEPLVYKGQPLCPDFDVTFDFNKINGWNSEGDRIKKFVKDKDYVISYINNDKPGIATALITGIGSCGGVQKTNFMIVEDTNTEQINAAYTFDNMTGISVATCFIALISLFSILLIRKQHS